MTEELEKKISETQRDQLVNRINELYDQGVLKIRDWMAIYEILINACEMESAAVYEKYMIDSLNEDGDSE